MRTDGVDVAKEALAAARRLIGGDYGKSYVPPAARQYQTKTKNAQEAHEAIRPTEVARRPREMKSFLDHDQARLYELIWLRMVASQMESAELERTTADITANAAGRGIDLRATGTVVKFDGFLTLYQEGEDDIVADEEGRRLPEMSAGERLAKRKIDAGQHFTEPPPRYSEASLVKRMEELGIGRPSTSCWRRICFRRARTAPTHANAPVAKPAGSRSSSASSAVSSAAPIIPNAAIRASSRPATAPTAGPTAA